MTALAAMSKGDWGMVWICVYAVIAFAEWVRRHA